MASSARRVKPDQLDPSQLTTAVRVFTTRRTAAKKRRQGERSARLRVWRQYPHEALGFDTETFTDPAQSLRILVWRLYRDRPDGTPGTTCIEEGIAYPDDLSTRDPYGFQVLARYGREREADVAAGYPIRMRVEPLSWWLEERLYRYGCMHADRCAIAGFNLLFDLGRLAHYWGRKSRADSAALI